MAAIVPIHNGRELTLRFLASLLGGRCRPDMVVVVDDGSTDGSAAAIRAAFPEVVVLRGNGNLWWSGAVNHGCRFAIDAGATHLWSLNNDCVVHPDALWRLCKTTRAKPKRLTCPKVYYWPHDGRIMSLGGEVNWYWRGLSLRQSADGPDAGLLTAQWLPGMGLFLPVAAYLSLGGVDERRFPHYRGDVDFTLRARKAGWHLAVDPEAVLFNDKSQTGLGLSQQPSATELLRLLRDRRSQYNLYETVPFFLRHAPVWALPTLFASYYGILFASFGKRILLMKLDR